MTGYNFDIIIFYVQPQPRLKVIISPYVRIRYAHLCLKLNVPRRYKKSICNILRPRLVVEVRLTSDARVWQELALKIFNLVLEVDARASFVNTVV